jgi:glycosyltransferase involved in cell wall biosynthesis
MTLNSAHRNIIILLPDLRGGGAERLHVHLAKHWHEQGFQVTFILMQKRGELIDTLSENIILIELGVKRLRHIFMPLSLLLRRLRPNLVIAAMWPLSSVAVLSWLMAGRPGRLCLSEHTQLSISCVHEIGISARIVGAIIRITYSFASGIIAVSEGVKKDMCRISGLSEKLVRVIYNPTALGISAHRESVFVRQELWGAGFDLHILSVGALKIQKDHETLIKAFGLLPKSLNAKLTILGEGGLRDELEALVVKLGLQCRVALPGFAVDPYPWFRSADLFVLSSRWEGFGNVIVEALECGVPVVSTDCPSGPAEILDNGRFGVLVPIQDPVALASAIVQSIHLKHNREALMLRASDFSVKKVAKQYQDYIFEKF